MGASSSSRTAANRKDTRAGAFACAATLAALVVLVGGGCGNPKYPSCDNDEHCNVEGHKGVCVNHVCVDCRSDEACGAGKTCNAGACTPQPGYCDETTKCPNGEECEAHRCKEGPKPVAAKPAVECDDDHPCKGGERCQNNHCVAPPKGGPGCTDFPGPKFDFESPELRADARSVLERLANCVNTGSLKGAHVLLTGHCDNRGENEFNMSLGAQRAEAVRGFLVGLGVPSANVATSSRGELDAAGTDEASFANDRRVDIEVR